MQIHNNTLLQPLSPIQTSEPCTPATVLAIADPQEKMQIRTQQPLVQPSEIALCHAELKKNSCAGESETLVERVGERQVTLRSFSESGRVQVELSPPPISSLVLSGGGAKGIAYPGALDALDEKGILAGVRSMHGASAGAISTAFLASGMSAAEFKKVANELNLISLLDSDGAIKRDLQQMVTAIVPGRLPNLIASLIVRLQSNANVLERTINDHTKQTLLMRISEEPGALGIPEINRIVKRFNEQADAQVTFRDLKIVSQHVPKVKTLNVVVTAMFDGAPQMVMFNSEQSPDLAIARAAHISGTIPPVFKTVNVSGLDFQKKNERTGFLDGGFMQNTPAPGLENSKLLKSVIPEDAPIIFMFQELLEKGAVVGIEHPGRLYDQISGTPAAAQNSFLLEKLDALRDDVITVPLQTNDQDFSGVVNGTLNFTMPDEDKLALQELLNKKTEVFLNARQQNRQCFDFESLEGALLALNDKALADVNEQNPEVAGEVHQFRLDARNALERLDNAIGQSGKQADTQNESMRLTDSIKNVLKTLDALASVSGKRHTWLAQQFNQPNTRFQRLLAVSGDAKDIESPTLKGALELMRKVDIATISDKVIRTVIYPEMYKKGQSDDNKLLLRRMASRISHATTAKEFNQCVDLIIKHYQPNNRWGKPSQSSTLNTLQQFRISEPAD